MELVQEMMGNIVSWVAQIWSHSLRQWGIFGTWLIFMAILRRVAKTFNKLKS